MLSDLHALYKNNLFIWTGHSMFSVAAFFLNEMFNVAVPDFVKV